MVNTTCPACGSNLNYISLDGDDVTCIECGSIIRKATPEEVAEQAAEMEPDDLDGDDYYAAERSAVSAAYNQTF
jgi:uncharacterized Zn finger protein (UPF0148 family)